VSRSTWVEEAALRAGIVEMLKRGVVDLLR
jgi:hypothetical protein